MAVSNNGQPQGPIQFTDDRAGKRIFVGPNTPTNPTDGDVWMDSDIFNNAGQNLISTTTLAGSASKDFSVLSLYKDIRLVFRGVQTSLAGSLNITVNDDAVNYVGGTTFFTINNYKPNVTTGHMALDIIDTQDTNSFTWGYLKGVFTANSNNAVNVIDSTGVYTQATALTKITLSVSTGTFTGGTVLVYGVN
jgi:hypothetical protein